MAKKAAAKPRPSSSGEDLVRHVLKSKSFESDQLEHVTAAARGFAVALLAARHPKKKLWVTCKDARTQDQVAADLAVFGEQALVFPKLTHAAGDDALPDPDLQAERLSVLTRMKDNARIVASGQFGGTSASAQGDRSS